MGGVIQEIEQGLIFLETDYVFKNFVEYFLNMRKEGGFHNNIGKSLINSLFGRLGMRNAKTYSFIDKKEKLNEIINKFDVVQYKEINKLILVEVSINEKLFSSKKNLPIPKDPNNNLSLAAIITSKARIKLYKAQQSVLKNEGRLLYSDTDNIYAAFKKDVTGEKHGEVIWGEDIIQKVIFFSARAFVIFYKNGSYLIRAGNLNSNYHNLKISERRGDQLVLTNNSTNIFSIISSLNDSHLIEYDLHKYEGRYFVNNFETKAFLFKKNKFIKAD